MTAFKMYQGDSYKVPFHLTQGGMVLTPEVCAEIEVSVGDALRKTLSSGGVEYDSERMQYYFRPTQQETLEMDPGTYEVHIRVRYYGADNDVRNVSAGIILILDAHSEAVI